MELSLLTGVKIILTIFDDKEDYLIQYKSDSIEAIQELYKRKITQDE